MEYIEGVPFRALLREGEEFGFSGEEIRKFEKIWDDYKAMAKEPGETRLIRRRNVIIEIETGNLIIIDPH